jgi:hypothetical protein
MTTNSELISSSVQFPNVLHGDNWQVTFSNIPTLNSTRDMRMYENYVKSFVFPDYNIQEIYSDIKGFRVRHPVGGIKANEDLSQVQIEFRISEDMKNYGTCFYGCRL